MQKTLYTLISVLLISFLINLSCAFGNQAGTLKSFFNNKTGFYYTVQKGDTLWDLSQKFYSSEWDWPGLWELNDKIKNPHLIYPGERLKVFFRGGLSLENRPTMKSKKEEKPVIVEPAKGTVKPVEGEIQLSFYYPLIDKVGFIKRNAISPAGKILRAENDNTDLISENDIIYVRAHDNGSLTLNTQYQVYETSIIKNRGVRHSIKGIIQIEERKQDYYTAKVIETYTDLNPDDLIMEFLERDREFIVKKENDKINAKIICNDNDDAMFGLRQVIYMDLGQDSAIKKGQVYTIYKTVGKKEVEFDQIPTGKLIVLHTEDISSTVLIFAANQEMHPGDPIH